MYKNRTITPYFFSLIFILFSFNAFSQMDIKKQEEKLLKDSLKFEIWKGKDKDLLYGINLSKINIKSLSDAKEIKSKNPFYTSMRLNNEFFVKYRSKWYINDSDFVEITLAFLNSANEAHNYIVDYYLIGSTLPLEIKNKAKDIPTIVGDNSFYNGQIFVRNNIVVNIHAEGKLKDRVITIAKEIDAELMKQKTYKSEELVKPKIKLDSNNNRIIEEP